MRKMRIWIATAFAVNLLLLPLLLATPDEVHANGMAWPWGDCCQESTEEQDFCCDNCCWFTNDCNSSSDCDDQ